MSKPRTFARFEEGIGQRKGHEPRDGENEEWEKLTLGSHQHISSLSEKNSHYLIIIVIFGTHVKRSRPLFGCLPGLVWKEVSKKKHVTIAAVRMRRWLGVIYLRNAVLGRRLYPYGLCVLKFGKEHLFVGDYNGAADEHLTTSRLGR